jgi:hypothetical protein
MLASEISEVVRFATHSIRNVIPIHDDIIPKIDMLSYFILFHLLGYCICIVILSGRQAGRQTIFV